jgi:hypothetical protein
MKKLRALEQLGQRVAKAMGVLALAATANAVVREWQQPA